MKVQYISILTQKLENCKFKFYYNKTHITPTVLDRGDEIILANWPNHKHIICSINNDIPIKIPSHPYVLMNKSVLCDCGIGADNHFQLESSAACHDIDPKLELTMYFTVNTAFVNYLNKFPNFTEFLEFPIFTNRMTFEQTLPFSLNVSKFNHTLLTASNDLKDFINSYTNHKELFDLQERHNIVELNSNKNFCSHNNIMDIFLFVTAIISLLVTVLTVYLLCNTRNLRTLLAALVLHQVKEVEAITQKEINSECKILAYVSLALTILGLIMVAILHY